jgi:uncharacterized repeat protein (TIGR03803 family)
MLSMMCLTAPSAVLAAVMASALFAVQMTQAQVVSVLHSFYQKEGSEPYGPLIQGTDGNLYGTTMTAGGSNGESGGTVFKITPGGTLTTLYAFCQIRDHNDYCSDGTEPNGVIEGRDGNFYGTTYNGGVENFGTVFRLTPGGVLTTLYDFVSESGGYFPFGGLIQASDGNFYGTTINGGATGQEDWGVVFKITSSGVYTVLHSFLAGAEGAFPYAGLVEASDGNLYGSIWGYGPNGGGTIFRITTGGTLTTLYGFCAQAHCADGRGPLGTVTQASDGNLYGVTAGGGTGFANCPLVAYGCGTAFKLTLGGVLTTLYNFCSQPLCADGAQPYAAPTQGSDGNLYGTTPRGGGPANEGSIFQISADGRFTSLYDFCPLTGCPDGKLPYAGLVQHTNGKFYGVAYHGGADTRDGTVYSLSVGLKPFVETLPTSGKAGTAVRILGTGLTGATSVRFNGTPAVFKIVAGSLITTTVPAGATSGQVQVLTSSGKILSSNVTFQVNP